MNRKNKHSGEYPNVPSAIRPVAHGPEITIPEPPKDFTVSESLSSTDTEDESAHDFWDQQSCGASSSKQPKLFSQDELNDLSRDLNLSKESAQLLGSRLRDHNLLASGTTFYWYRNRDEEFRKYFTWDEQHSLLYCNDVGKLVSALGMQYKATEWRLFLDSSVRSKKAILLHIGNKVASVPIAHSIKFKECYLDMKHLLEVLLYVLHQWKLCGDLKMIAILLGLQGGYTKFPCFFCFWDSRAEC